MIVRTHKLRLATLIPAFWILVGLVLCLLTLLAWAGTWSDGFEGEKPDGWQLAWSRGATTFKTENGVLVVEVRSPFVSFLRVVGSNLWKGYTVSVRVKILEILGPLVDGGIMIRETGVWQNNYYFL